MQPQNQWLFETPFISKASYYSNLGFDDELAFGSIENELSDSETDQVTHYLITQPKDFFTPSPSRNCNLVLPKGKGIFVGSLAYLKLTTTDIVKRVKNSGLSWLAIERIWQDPSGTKRCPRDTCWHNPDMKNLVNALRTEVDGDFGIWIWGYPDPRNVPEFITALIEKAIEVGAQGIIADPEKPWNTERVKSKAKNLMDELLNAAHANCLSVGITSYGKPIWGRNMAWEQFSRADFGLPQIYSVNQGSTYPSEAISSWKANGFKAIIPVLASDKKHVPSVDDMKAMLSRTHISNCAIAWWSWKNTTSETRWQIISNAQIPKYCSPKLPADYSCVMPRTNEFESESGSQFCMRVPIMEKPTPCRFYTIKHQIDTKGLIDLASRAYGVQSSSQKVKLAQWINNHPYNHRFWKTSLATGDFPKGRISFNPTFSHDINQQARTINQAPIGNSFATIFIPPPPSWLGQTFSSC